MLIICNKTGVALLARVWLRLLFMYFVYWFRLHIFHYFLRKLGFQCFTDPYFLDSVCAAGFSFKVFARRGNRVPKGWGGNSISGGRGRGGIFSKLFKPKFPNKSKLSLSKNPGSNPGLDGPLGKAS